MKYLQSFASLIPTLQGNRAIKKVEKLTEVQRTDIICNLESRNKVRLSMESLGKQIFFIVSNLTWVRLSILN